MFTLVALASYPACNSCGSSPAPQGSAAIAWSITMAGQPVTCARAGVASASLLLHNRSSGDDAISSFPCTATDGTTAPVPTGAYDATLTLHATDGAVVATAPVQTAITIAAGQVTTLRPATLPVSNRGDLVLSIAELGTTSNCLPPDVGGAGITGHAITLRHAAGACARVTLQRMRGATPIGTYVVDCVSPAITTCIERDETLHTLDVEPGAYAISVSALVGTVLCGSGDDVVLVGAGVELPPVKPIQLAPVLNRGC